MTGAADWQGRVGRSWADAWSRTERAFAGIGAVLDAAIRDVAPVAGRALDIGCGVGSTALALAEARPAISVTGVDLSRSLVSVALTRVCEDHEVSFFTGDVLDAAEPLAPLDLAVSRHGVMFFADPAADDRARLEDRLRDLFAARSRNGAVAFTAAITIWHATA